MDRKSRLKIEEDFEKRNGLFVPTEFGGFVIPRKAKVLHRGGPEIKGNWGQDVRLEAGIAVLTKDGEVLENREWESKSFTRWFSRVVQSTLDNTNPVVTDFQGSVLGPAFASTSSANPFFPPSAQPSAGHGLGAGQFSCGARLAIGNGPLTGAQSGFTNLKAMLFHQSACIDGITTQDDNAAMAFDIVTGITLATIAGATIQEVGLFSVFQQQFANQSFMALMAYDEVSPGVVAAYGTVIAPRYSLSFAA
jgi:hypothetical protein